MEGLLKQAGERVAEINRLMSLIEDTGEKLGMIGEDAEPAYITGTGVIVKLNDLATTEQAGRIREAMRKEVEACMAVNEGRLAALIGTAGERLPAVKKVKSGNKLDVEIIKKLYHADGMTIKDTAKACGCSTQTLHDFMKRNGIESRKRGGDRNIPKATPAEVQEHPELTVDAVREIYTKGDASLADAAVHFGISGTELHLFVDKHGLKKVPKKDKIFRDSGKAKP